MKRINFSKSAPLPRGGWAPPKKNTPKKLADPSPPSDRNGWWGGVDLGTEFKTYRQPKPDDRFETRWVDVDMKDVKIVIGDISWSMHVPEKTAPTRDHRTEAVLRLWQEAAKGVVIRHPDPTTSVELWVGKTDDDPFRARYSWSWGETATLVRLTMRNLRDTQDQDRRHAEFPALSKVFHAWHGTTMARTYFLAMMCVYLQHEAMELTTVHYNDRWSPHLLGCTCRRCAIDIVNAHGYCWHQQYATKTPLDICDLIMGPGWTADQLKAGARRADEQLQKEIDYLMNGGY